MTADHFSRREVHNAFRKFFDTVQDVLNANENVWEAHFRRLMHHCEHDSVMRVVTEPLRNNDKVNIEEWQRTVQESPNAKDRILRRYDLPEDDEDMAALLYQFFLHIHDYKGDRYSLILHFCCKAYRTGSVTSSDEIRGFNSELVSKFARTFQYRLEEIEEDTAQLQEVPREALIVFNQHHHFYRDHAMNIQGNIQGSNVATGGSAISK